MRNTQILSNMIFSGLLLCAGIANAQQSNTISRIDSLTHMLYETVADQPKAQLGADEVLNITETTFDSLTATLGTIIPFKLHDAVRQQMRYMVDPSSTFLWRASQRKDMYFHIFEEVLDKKGLPQEIKYLSVIESALNPNAVSWCGATGLWQFMPATGRMMDLEINSWVDERKDFYKSTEKACEYLQSNYNRFGDWLLAIAAYNCGPGNVSKAISRSGGKKTFWEIRPYLPRETQNYIPKFLATAFLMNFSPVTSDSKLDKDELMVQVPMNDAVHFKYISAVLGIPTETIGVYNAAYTGNVVTGSSISTLPLVLPYAQAMQLVAMKDSIYTVSSNAFNPEDYTRKETRVYYYKVKKGETISQAASKNHCSVSQLKRWNRLRSTKLKAGQTLRICETVTISIPVRVPENQKYFFYVVDGTVETLKSICAGFSELDVELTRSANNISDVEAPLTKGSLLRIYTKAN